MAVASLEACTEVAVAWGVAFAYSVDQAKQAAHASAFEEGIAQ